MPDQPSDSATRATARLPGLDIEIEHRQLPGADGERISIHVQAMPSFEAFGRFLEAANPFAFWLRAVQLAWQPWQPWLGRGGDLASPTAAQRTLPKASEP